MRKLPVGIQSFDKIIEGGFIYIDKTAYMYELVHQGAPVFLSRPRRFGKSLFLSTLRAYWEGRKELFKGLAIEKLEKDNPDAWQEYPVFYFDFNKKNFKRDTALEEVLIDHLREWEGKYDLPQNELPLEERFQHLIKKAYEVTGKQAVVLVDEYDKPLLEAMTSESLEEHNKAVFKGFFSTLKSYDRYLKFVFLTGVTKFSKVSIFSDLNQLQDISLDYEYASIAGITEEEMKSQLQPEIKAMADSLAITVDECIMRLKKMYDGYHFHQNSEDVYNPFSLLSSLLKKEFRPFWFETGTPTFLVKRLKELNYDIRRFTDGSIYMDYLSLSDYRADNPDPVPLLYQTGYLTIKGYDYDMDYYLLEYPNDEVKNSFIKYLAPEYLYSQNETPLDVRMFRNDILDANLDSLRSRFVELFARIPYRNEKDSDKYVERDFQNVIYIVFMLLGQFVHAEPMTATGRADVILETDKYIYLFEFKRDKTADEALQQISDKKYSDSYAADPREKIKIGVNFDTVTRSIDEWKVER